jgi:hypothetical protein
VEWLKVKFLSSSKNKKRKRKKLQRENEYFRMKKSGSLNQEIIVNTTITG